jgi:hypothetical protein
MQYQLDATMQELFSSSQHLMDFKEGKMYTVLFALLVKEKCAYFDRTTGGFTIKNIQKDNTNEIK